MRWLERFLLFLLSFVVFPSCLASCFLSSFHLAFPLAFCFLSILHFLLFVLFPSCLLSLFILPFWLLLSYFYTAFCLLFSFYLAFPLAFCPRSILVSPKLAELDLCIYYRGIYTSWISEYDGSNKNNNTNRKQQQTEKACQVALLMCYCNHFSSLKLFCLLWKSLSLAMIAAYLRYNLC